TALLAFAVLSMLAYLTRFYYLLESTLLEKSVVLALTGAWLLVSCMVWRSLGQGGRQPHGHAAAAHAVEPGAVTANAPHTLRNQRRPGGLHQSAGLLAGLAVILAVVNLGIYQRDQILKHGESVILALAPVDPRSLMQGDYMALRFQVADEIRAALANPASPLVDAIKAQRGGFLIL